jgi:uncharacterized membrane protein YqgA involved in biofilm formation
VLQSRLTRENGSAKSCSALPFEIWLFAKRVAKLTPGSTLAEVKATGGTLAVSSSESALLAVVSRRVIDGVDAGTSVEGVA